MHYIIMSSSNAALNLVPYVVAAMLVAFGVKLHLDKRNENCYIETSPGHDHLALRFALGFTWRLGFEPLDEAEDEPMTTPEGGVRIYLAERWQL